MEIIGRITKDAIVKTVPSGSEVMNFSIAINERYKPKGSTEIVQQTTYVNCSDWVRMKLAPYLKKGSLVELSGSLSVNAYTNLKGDAAASINFHVNGIKLHGKSNGAEVIEKAQPVRAEETADDLPF